MKTYSRLFALLLCLGLATTSCREDTKETMDPQESEMGAETDGDMDNYSGEAVEEGNEMDDTEGATEKTIWNTNVGNMQGTAVAAMIDMEPGTEVKVKDEKFKMEDSEKEVTIKTRDNGTVEKIEIEYKDGMGKWTGEALAGIIEMGPGSTKEVMDEKIKMDDKMKSVTIKSGDDGMVEKIQIEYKDKGEN